MQSLEERFNVKISIHNGKSKQSILIQGHIVDTSQAHVDISNIFRRVEVATLKKSQESLIAKTVQTSGKLPMFQFNELVQNLCYDLSHEMVNACKHVLKMLTR